MISDNEYMYGIKQLLSRLGDNPERDGLKETPRRVFNTLLELTSGYNKVPEDILKVTFDSYYDEMCIMRDIPFSSLCEHHIMPFWGVCHIGYIPSNGKVVGISKLVRLVKCFSSRLQIQEKLTQDIANTIQEVLEPIGVGVIISATHSCMTFRGACSHGSFQTSCLLGAIKDKPEARNEFLHLIGEKP